MRPCFKKNLFLQQYSWSLCTQGICKLPSKWIFFRSLLTDPWGSPDWEWSGNHPVSRKRQGAPSHQTSGPGCQKWSDLKICCGVCSDSGFASPPDTHLMPQLYKWLCWLRQVVHCRAEVRFSGVPDTKSYKICRLKNSPSDGLVGILALQS